LQHNVELLARHGIREITINLHHCPDVVTNYFGDGSRFGVSITYSHEPELLGTAGAVKKLESFFQDTFLVIYGDNLIECDLHRLLAFHQERAGIVTIALHYRDDVTKSGVVALDEFNRVLRFVEKPQANQVLSHWVNAGVMVLEPGIFKYIPPAVPLDFGKNILPNLLEQGEKVYGYWLDDGEKVWWIDTPTDLERIKNTFTEVHKR
jgi:NDP-sugar pyrophosphorylase family protein